MSSSNVFLSAWFPLRTLFWCLLTVWDILLAIFTLNTTHVLIRCGVFNLKITFITVNVDLCRTMQTIKPCVSVCLPAAVTIFLSWWRQPRTFGKPTVSSISPASCFILLGCYSVGWISFTNVTMSKFSWNNSRYENSLPSISGSRFLKRAFLKCYFFKNCFSLKESME